MKNATFKTMISVAVVAAVFCGITMNSYAVSPKTNTEENTIYAHTPDGTVIEMKGEPFEEEGEILLLSAGKDVIYAHAEDGTVLEIEGKPFEEDGEIVVRSALKPSLNASNYYDLSASDYDADLAEVSPVRWLYTNKYFLCSSSGRIYVDYSIKILEGASRASMKIGIFDLTANTSYTNFSTDEITNTVSYSAGNMYFSGLNPDHFYCVGFLSAPSTIGETPLLKGSAVISQS